MLDRLKQEIINFDIPLSNNFDVLKSPIKINTKKIANRLLIQPMEGCDGREDGGIDVLTARRYERFAKSGAGTIWFEAVAITEEGKANKNQLLLNNKTLDGFKKLVNNVKEICQKENGFEPVIIMQATHSGRYSKPKGTAKPLIAYNNPVFEKDNPIDKKSIVSDDYLKEMEEKYAESARFAKEAGFDGIDIKCCHRYLLNELLSAYTREGNYGGSFENRTRLFINAIKSAKSAVSGDFEITSRLNVYDGFEYPYGFGASIDKKGVIDLTEPLKLINILHNELEIKLLNVSIGNPYVNPHVNRPFENGPYKSPENPLLGVERMYKCVGQVQKAFKNLVVVGSGVSYLREKSANLAAGSVEQGYCQISGFGRMAFAYPNFANDILKKGSLDKKKCCIACSKCSELMRASSVAGCVIKDSKTYMPYYKKIKL